MEILMLFRKLACLVTTLSLTTATAWGADCQALVKSFVNGTNPSASNLKALMVTLNNQGVASYTEFSNLSYQLGINGAGGIPKPGRFLNISGIDIPPVRQLFSDRKVNQAQPFDMTQSDELGLEITDSQNVSVTVILKSRGNAKATFAPSCNEGGFMNGDTPDVHYILFLKK
jgi:hypothetical protein